MAINKSPESQAIISRARVSGVRLNLIKSFPLIVLPGEAVKYRRHDMSYTKRSNSDFLAAKAKGQKAEKELRNAPF